MKAKDRRGYRRRGLQFTNIEFSSQAERSFVKTKIEKFALRIAALRKERKISQERLAELANVSVSTIKFIEQNQRAPSLPLLLKLVFILDRKTSLWG
jgi:DNA-binding XRE family transcriptional regulator